jgi:hypothetical protein
LVVHIKLVQCTACDEETCSVGRSPVGEAIADSVALEFMGIGSAEDFVATKLRSDNLADDVSVGESNDKTIFGRVVFVLGLSNEAFASVVVSLACSSALVLGLEAAAEQG